MHRKAEDGKTGRGAPRIMTSHDTSRQNMTFHDTSHGVSPSPRAGNGRAGVSGCEPGHNRHPGSQSGATNRMRPGGAAHDIS